jgi:hypothetical protein
VIPLLTEPSDGRQAFHVVAPSIPGYGFSDYSKKVGFGLEQHARCFAILMKKLGYKKYVCQVCLYHFSEHLLTKYADGDRVAIGEAPLSDTWL